MKMRHSWRLASGLRMGKLRPRALRRVARACRFRKLLPGASLARGRPLLLGRMGSNPD